MKAKLLLLLFLANFSIYAQTNLVPNDGFEIWTGTGSTFTDWTITNYVSNSFDVAQGRQSASLIYINASPKITTQVPMKAGVTYTVKYKYKYVSSNYGGDHPISLNISQTGSSATLSSSTFATDNLWTEKVTTFTADKDLSYELSFSTFSFDNASFEVLIDAIQIYAQGTEQYTKIPNLNFEKKLIALGFDSGSPDGQVPTININTLPYLDVSSSSISDLTGIEDFTALNTLDCSQTGLINLDISKNTNLRRLNCGINHGLKNFDVSKNPDLIYLDCSNNSLLTLDLTSNTALQYLEATNNYLTSLDLSNNTNLLECQIRGNNLTSLDLSKNTALKKATFINNRLTSLDLSKNTALEVLELGSNQLTSIDLSKNKLLTDLIIYTNQLTSLDLSHNNALVSLNCSSNKLTSLNLKNGNNSNFLLNHSISYINIDGNSGSLPNNSSFLSNQLSCIQVDDSANSTANWSAIKDKEAYFTSLDCSQSTIIPDSKFEDKLIALGIDNDGKNGAVLTSSINTVTTLDVSGITITNLTGIEGFTSLTNLNASGNALKRLNLSKNTALTTLNSSGNPDLICIEVPNLAAASNWTVTKDASTGFSLDCNVYTLIPDSNFEDYLISKNIDKDGKNGKVLTESIDKITNLYMDNQGISDLTGIEDFKALKQLSVYRNQISKIDVSKNLDLENLSVDNNKLTSLDISQNKLLVSVDCGGNLLSNIDITNNLELRSLTAGNNKLQDIDLSQNTNLTYLLVNQNNLTSLDLSKNVKLSQIWCQSNQIRTLDFSNNPKLYQVLAHDNKLVNLNFKNGGNTLISVTSGNNGGVRFTGNPDLKCIQVDDSAYSDTNWADKKDAAATFSSAACSVVVPYTSIPDSNFEDKLIALGIDDVKDGKVKTMDIVTLTNLNLSNSNITDLTGLEDFTKLASLNVSDNDLTTIDVSKNIQLTDLNVGRNKLTNLDVSKNLFLSTLKCNSNTITTLDVSQNSNLTALSASFNKIQYLDVSTNKFLKEIDCAVNDLYNLNVQNGNNINMQGMSFGNFTENPHLLCIQVDDVTFSTDNWIAKDASASYSSQACPFNEQMTLIPDSNFEKILIAKGIDTDGLNGKVRTANISNLKYLTINDSSTKVSDLTGIEDFRSLASLDVNSNNLTALDVSKNTLLTSLSIKDNQLTALDVTKNTSLNYLNLSNNNVTTLDVSKNISLNLIDAGNNQLTSVDVSKNLSLIDLGLESNQLATIDVSKNISLKYLYLDQNEIESVNVTENKELLSLNVSGNNLTSLDVSQNIKLTYLNVSSNLLVSLDLTKNTELRSIDCSNNQIRVLDFSGNSKMTQIYTAVNKLYSLNIKNGNNVSLSYISFGSNPYLKCIQVDDSAYANTNWSSYKDDAASFSSEICPVEEPFTLIPDSKFEDKLIALGIDKDGKNGKVSTISIDSVAALNIANSGITDLTGIEGFKALTSLEAANNQLTAINVSKNGMLTNLNVSKNQLTSLATDSNYRLVNLNLSYNSVTSLSLHNNYSLKTLNCSNNKIASLNLIYTSQLVSLNCSNNDITTLDTHLLKDLTILSASFNKLERLDVSKNTVLKEIDCASNNLYNLNLQNGNNVNMERVIFGNFTENPNLLCIQVDDIAYSNQNWIAKDATAEYSTEACMWNEGYTQIPDVNFERALIALNIDKDGENGKVATASISGIRNLSVRNRSPKITDLTGIEDFTALETLDCSNNNLTTLDVSKNVNLEGLDCSYNSLISVDFSQNTALSSLSVYNNQLISLDVSKNTDLQSLAVSDNKLTSIDLSKNLALKGINLSNNQLTSIDLSKNINLNSVTITNNQLSSIDVSKNPSLTILGVNNNQLTNIDVSNNILLQNLRVYSNKLENLNISNNILLTQLSLSDNKISTLDVSNNPALTFLDASKNQLQTLDVSKNPALISLSVNSNQLTSLNVKNGNNTILQNFNLYLGSNPKLTCILVDDVVYSNTNWLSNKDAIATYNTECTGELVLPTDNFAIETKGESCLGENNGEINIKGKASFAYTATINDKSYTFTDNSLKVASLAPGVYKIKISIPDMIFEQDFNVTIAKGATITGKSSLTSKTVNLEITEGTAPFTVFIDGAEQFQTTDTNFTVDLEKAGLIEVATAKACEGIFAKKVSSAELGSMLVAYPNPTYGTIEIEIPSVKTETVIELFNFGGQLVSKGTYNTESGKAVLNLENLPAGIYAAKIYLETPEYIKIIKK